MSGTQLTQQRQTSALVFACSLSFFVLIWLIWPTMGGYDTASHLVWGREILAGRTPSFESYIAPTEHPLWLAIATVAEGVFSVNSDRAMTLIAYVSLAVLAAAVSQLAGFLYSELRASRAVTGAQPVATASTRLVQITAAITVSLSVQRVFLAAHGYLDALYLAMIFSAAVLLVQPGGNRDLTNGHGGALRVSGLGAAALIALAGLLRPEAWLLGCLLLLWRLPKVKSWLGRITAAVLCLAPPMIWSAIDYAVTDKPLYSFTGTAELAETLQRKTGLAAVPKAFVSSLAGQAGAIVAVVGLACAALVAFGAFKGWRGRAKAVGADGSEMTTAADGPRSGLFSTASPTFVVAVLLAVSLAAFVGAGVFGLSLLPRYLATAAVCLSLLLVVSAFVWLPTKLHVLVLPLMVALVALQSALAGWTPGSIKHELDFLTDSRKQVYRLSQQSVVQRAFRGDPKTKPCGPLITPSYRLVPQIKLYSGGSPVGPRGNVNGVFAGSDPLIAIVDFAFMPSYLTIAQSDPRFGDLWFERYVRAAGERTESGANNSHTGAKTVYQSGPISLHSGCR